MSECIFCKIVAGHIPCYKVYEDGLFLGFLDIRPLSKGNSLLIPKKHYRWATDVVEFAQYFEAAKKIALATQKIVKSDYTTFLTLGMEVEHSHIRIIPRFFDDQHKEGINTKDTIEITKENMIDISSNIFNTISL